ncbi:MAG: hypothetical protein U5L98_07810 [Halomonas sp.]|uniref:hypothetical protein n=1 Tax=Halomonas sp. TaxID=1486246 RepID=UPI002ACED0D8|nr:hypothetical protein [Halomonas sp.]MDZ7852544.1 hypothetical protein [Halomonas sp.]
MTDAIVVAFSDTLNEELPLPYLFDVINDNTLVNNDLIEHISRVGIKLYEKNPM